MMDEGERELRRRLKAIANALPEGSELQRLLLNLEDPANDRASKDRYIALVAGNAVDQALRIAVARHRGIPAEALGKLTFADSTTAAQADGLIVAKERIEIDRIRVVRNTFAHAPTPISFDQPEVEELVRMIFDHPVTDWASYFAPAFPARDHYALACGEFCRQLIGTGDVEGR